MYYNDGHNPWEVTETTLHIFTFDSTDSVKLPEFYILFLLASLMNLL